MQQGEKLLAERRYQDAISHFRQYYLEHPHAKEAPLALLRIGNIYRLHLKDFKKSIEAFGVLSQRFPETDEGRQAQLLLGGIHASQFNDYQQAIVEYQKVVLGKGYSDGQRIEALLKTGNAYFSLGNFVQARIEYKKLKQEYAESYAAKVATLQLANCFNAEGDCQKAIPIYQEVAAFTGDEIKNLAVQGTFAAAACFEELGKYEEALKLFDSVKNSYPSRRVVEVRIEKLKARMHEVIK